MLSINLFVALKVLRIQQLKSPASFVMKKDITLITVHMIRFIPRFPNPALVVTQNSPFVPTSSYFVCLADISTTTTSVKTHIASGSIVATDVEGITRDPLVEALVDQFNPLPTKSPTPINLELLAIELRHSPNAAVAKALLDNIYSGFKIGYDGPHFSNKTYNLKSAEEHPQVIASNILIELKEKRIAGPFKSPPLPFFRTSPIGVVPKKDSSKFRTIMDLSSPPGLAINDFISDCESSVCFNTFDSAVNIIAEVGKGALMAKLDIKSAFRICPVHPSDWHLLGFCFRDYYFVDLCLPFGLRSSVNRFTQLSDTLSWILRNNYNIKFISHYLDDFFLAGPAPSGICKKNMTLTQSLFKRLGVPLAPDKIIGPTTTLTYLGIVIDSANMELRLPQDKLRDLSEALISWETKRKCTKRKLLSLIGKLSFATKIIPAGRIFLRRLIDLSKSVSKLNHRVSLNSDTRKDIQWWKTFLPLWNGRYKILDPRATLSSELNLFTDASGSLGFGIYFEGRWISHAWPPALQTYSIQWKELFPIYLACFIWARSLAGKRILFHCDTASIVDIWSTQSSKCPNITNLLRHLFFIAAKHEFSINITHIPGLDNSLADCLSRLQVQRFRQIAPHADRDPVQIPTEAWIF